MKRKLNHFTKFWMCSLGLFAFLFFSFNSTFAQISAGGIPKSFRLGISVDQAPIKSMPSIDLSKIKAEDEATDNKTGPWRFAIPFQVNFNIQNTGLWTTLDNGDRIWQLNIECKDARNINLLYSDFYIPKGALLYLYNEDKTEILGAFGAHNNNASNQFATAIINDDFITVEYFEPLAVKDQGRLSISQVAHGYRGLDINENEKGLNDAGNCQVNVNCSPEGDNWQDEKKGVCRLTNNGFSFCSGSLINNTAGDCTPYMLTADHCIGSIDAVNNPSAANWVLYWNYERASCANTGAVPMQTTAGATCIANDVPSDFALFLLTENPADVYDVYFNGFNATTTTGLGGAGIHHPSGDAKKIATHSLTPTMSAWGGGPQDHWRVLPWDATPNGQSVTEGGSSGSPLFDSNSRIIGQLHGGSSINCSNPSADPGVYGGMWVSWNNNGTTSPQRRVSDWLDPVGGGTNMILDGAYNPCSIQNNDDCLGASPIACNSSVSGSTVGMDVGNGPSCEVTNSNAGGVWFTFDGDGSCVTLTTCNAATDFDTRLRVYSGSCAALVCEEGNDDSDCGFNSLRSTVDLVTTVGSTYYVLLDGFGSSEGDFQLDFICDPIQPLEVECPVGENLGCDEAVPTAATTVDEFLAMGGSISGGSCQAVYTIVSEDVISGDICSGVITTRNYTITETIIDVSTTCSQIFTAAPAAAPSITFCPAPQTVSCPADIITTPDAILATLDCGTTATTSVSGPVIVGAVGCASTTYTYFYRVIDECGRMDECEQVFTIGENDAPTISAPVDYEVTCLGGSNPNPAWATYTTACDNGVAADVTVTGPQILGPLDCPGTRYIYTYTVTDACGRSASDTQTLTVANDGPELTCPAPLQVFGCLEGNFNDKIEAWIETVDASSSCGVDLTVSNDFNGNAGICLGNNFTTVTFSATDACNRTSTCEGTITITDTNPPVIYTDPQELLVPCTGNTQEIFNEWLATQGGAQAVDDCWTDNVSWSASVGPNALNCSNGPQAIVVTFTATDGCGNSATTTGIFNTKLLPQFFNVSGLIQREDSEPVADVQVGAYLGSGLPQMDMSDNAGDYAFPELAFDENTEIVPEKNDDPLNGLSTFDLVLLQQHILGLNTLNSPYKMIAADINRSGNISTLDMVLLRKLILHIDEEFTDNTSWRFVDADYVFPNPQNPFANEFPEIYNVAGQEDEVADFIAVKIGDLNLDGDTYGLGNFEADDRNREGLEFSIEDQELIAGEEYRIDVSAQNFEQINGFQFTLNFENGIEVLNIEAGDLVNFNEQNFNLAKRENGAIPMSWNMDRAQDLSSEDVAFSVIITANANVRLSKVLSITSQYTKAEAYQATELLNVNLTFNDNGQMVRATEFKLFQNTPNPFKDATTIGFQLPEAGEVLLEIFDVAGKLVHVQRGDFAAGYNQIDLDRANLQAGVLYYQVSTAKDSDSKKMILMD